MNLTTVRSTLALALSFYLGVASLGTIKAAAPAIGTALANGAFRVDNATLTGNATLFEGSVLETQTVPSSIQLSSGARLSLGIDSRGRLFGDRLVLEKGSTDLENTTGFKLVALGLTIQPDRGASTGSISFDGTRRLRVASTGGALRVLNANGLLVANLAPGTALAFEPQQGASNATLITGLVVNKSGHYVITDGVTKVAIEVVGGAIDKEVGYCVEVTGALDPTATPVNDASQVIRAREVHRIGKCDKSAVAGAVGAAGAATAGAAAGGATIGGIAVGTVAVVGGVAAAATVGGLAAAKKLPGQDSGPVSR